MEISQPGTEGQLEAPLLVQSRLTFQEVFDKKVFPRSQGKKVVNRMALQKEQKMGLQAKATPLRASHEHTP